MARKGKKGQSQELSTADQVPSSGKGKKNDPGSSLGTMVTDNLVSQKWTSTEIGEERKKRLLCG